MLKARFNIDRISSQLPAFSENSTDLAQIYTSMEKVWQVQGVQAGWTGRS
jgi:hypothetical protein